MRFLFKETAVPIMQEMLIQYCLEASRNMAEAIEAAEMAEAGDEDHELQS